MNSQAQPAADELDVAACRDELARLREKCAAAQGGQILISQRVLSAVEPLVQAQPVGELDLKGFARPVATYNVTGLTTLRRSKLEAETEISQSVVQDLRLTLWRAHAPRSAFARSVRQMKTTGNLLTNLELVVANLHY